MSECTHNCETCNSDCAERDPKSLLAPLCDGASVKKVIAVVSGKGGVGKSMVTSLLAVTSQKNGKKTAILDADITGPSVPKMFGIGDKAEGDGVHIFPVVTKTGIELMSINLLLPDDTDPVVWRGPVIAGAVKQFWTDVMWNDIELMFIDCPPGTGDVPLTVFQSIPVDGIIVVTSPQELVSMIVEKAVKMAQMMNVPILGIVENMSYYVCTDCGKKHAIFGESHVDAVAERYGIETVARLPMDPAFARAQDEGLAEDLDGSALTSILDAIDRVPERN